MKFRTLNDLYENKSQNGDLKLDDIKEWLCFKILLDSIKAGKCKIGLHEEIDATYEVFDEKCAAEIWIKYSDLLRNAHNTIDCKEEIKIDFREHYAGTLLESKIPFIFVANKLKNKMIASTKEAVENIYDPNLPKLRRHKVKGIGVCEAKAEFLFTNSSASDTANNK